jgi:signal transduction histidine kinase
LAGIAEVRLSDRLRLRGGGPDLFALTLRDAQDIRVLQHGPWFTVKGLLLASGLGLGALGLALLWAFALRRRVEKRTAQLAREIRARRDAEIEFKATLTERSRVGAELHDSLEQGLTGLSLQLQAAQLAFETQPKQSRDHLQTARRLLDQSRNDLRQSVGRLRSDGRPRRDLVTELQEMAEPMALGTGRGIVVEGSCPAERVPELIGHHALRTCQEALTNAVKHSQAKTIRVIIGCANGTLTLQVLDDGVGFQPNNAPNSDNGHFGLSGMRERVHRLGGTVSIQSVPGQGTHLEARIPLPPHPPPAIP